MLIGHPKSCRQSNTDLKRRINIKYLFIFDERKI